MKPLKTVALFVTLLCAESQADCLSGEELAASVDVALTAQTAYVSRKDSIWRIDGRNPYAADNSLSDVGVTLGSACSVVKNVLDFDVSLSALGYYPSRRLGAFEQDDARLKLLTDALRLTYALADDLRLEGGKLRPPQGLFYLRSPGRLLNNYYAGFKPTRLYDADMKTAYEASFWGGRLSRDARDYALSLTVAPKLARIDKYYESSSSWSANQRGNSSERYLLSYSDFRLENHAASLSLMLGESPSVAISDGYRATPQFVVSAEVALHTSQQWRHFSSQKKQAVQAWQFPSSLYAAENKKGVELALGGQYTTDRFSLFGLEYYLQSEGYSRSEWREQTEFIRYLNRQTGYAPIDRAFDSYKYLMGSEISNTSNKGMLQGKHYVNAYASLLHVDGVTLQPYLVMNIVDGSALAGAHVVKPLKGLNDGAEIYGGLYSALGSRDSEFALFGETLGIYAGFKYHL